MLVRNDALYVGLNPTGPVNSQSLLVACVRESELGEAVQPLPRSNVTRESVPRKKLLLP
jgi:hypothetical protein